MGFNSLVGRPTSLGSWPCPRLEEVEGQCSCWYMRCVSYEHDVHVDYLEWPYVSLSKGSSSEVVVMTDRSLALVRRRGFDNHLHTWLSPSHKGSNFHAHQARGTRICFIGRWRT